MIVGQVVWVTCRCPRLGEPLVEARRIVTSWRNGWWVFIEPDMPQVTPDAVGVMDSGADLHVGATLGAGADVNFKNTHE